MKTSELIYRLGLVVGILVCIGLNKELIAAYIGLLSASEQCLSYFKTWKNESVSVDK